MEKNILVAYASRSGSTEAVAESIGRAVRSRGVDVFVKEVREVNSLSGYDSVILGSSIRMGSWLGEAKRFVNENRAELNRMPVAIFTMHLLNLDESPESVDTRMGYVDQVIEAISPMEVKFFAGKYDIQALPFRDYPRSMVFRADECDLRDFDEIKAWGEMMASELALKQHIA